MLGNKINERKPLTLRRTSKWNTRRKSGEKSGESEESKEGMDGAGGSYKYSYSSYRLRPSQTNLFSATDTVFCFFGFFCE